MNTLKKIAMLCLLVTLTVGAGFMKTTSAQPGVSVPVESFYDELAPYGQWGQHPAYGNIWQPNVGPDFQPYASDGHWIVTEYGNTWVSDYAWGWAPFHYGRWVFDPAYGGWMWVPGSDWGPAWVSWRSGGGYYGWAPLGPGIDVNVNINIPAPYWTFVPQVYINSPQLYSYRVPRPNVINIYQRTTIINNVYRTNNRVYAYGPSRNEIERLTRRPVTVYRVDQLDRPGRSVIGNGSVGFYRPGPGGNPGRTYNRSDRYSRNPYDNGQNYGAYNNTPSPNGGYNRNYGGHNWTDANRSERPDAPRNNTRNYPNRGDYNGNGTPDGNVIDRSVPSRGGYNPGGATPADGYGQRPGRSYEAERVGRGAGGTVNPGQPAPDRGYQQSMPQSRGRVGAQPEPRQAEPRQAEPRQAEPRQAEPRQAEPRQAEPRQAEPRQAEPRQAEQRGGGERSNGGGPSHGGPSHGGPSHGGPPAGGPSRGPR